jgi:hypothetical protein
MAKVNKSLAGEDVAVILMRGRGDPTAVMDGNMSAPGYGPMAADRLEMTGAKGTLIYDRERLTLWKPATSPRASRSDSAASSNALHQH